MSLGAAGPRPGNPCRRAEPADLTGSSHWAAGGGTNLEALAAVTSRLRDSREPDRASSVCAYPSCAAPARGKSRWCSDTHKRAAARQRSTEAGHDLREKLPVCERCGTRFVNPMAAELHHCEGPR